MLAFALLLLAYSRCFDFGVDRMLMMTLQPCRLTTSALVCMLLISASPIEAHHSFVGFYDQERTVEIEGRVKSVSWRNPHGSMTIEVTSATGETVDWLIETGSISVLRVRGFDGTVVRVGDRVRVAGEPSLKRDHGLYARNVLLPSGEEVLLSIGVVPRWSGSDAAGLAQAEFDEDVAAAARRSASGIFRVWSTVFEDPNSFPMFKGNYPLSESAREIKARWDPNSVIAQGCAFKGMPSLMVTPYPIEFIDNGDEILIRFEEEDATRTIRMDPNARKSTRFVSIYGFSRGRWEGTELVVETDSISAEYFDYEGTPQSPAARYVERFVPSEDGSRLDYRITVIDPDTFTETFDLTRYFVWRPELVVNPYDCVIGAP